MSAGTTRSVAAALAAVTAVVLFVGWWTSDARRVHRRLDALEDLMSKAAGESDIASLAATSSVVSFFAPGFVVLAEPYEGRLTDRQQLSAAVHRYRRAGDEIELEIGDRTVEVRDNATATVEFVATVVMGFGGEVGRESYLVHSLWLEDEREEWLVKEMAIVEVLEGGAILDRVR